MLMFYIFLPIWTTNVVPEQSISAMFDTYLFSCTPFYVQVSKEEKSERYGYVSLHKILVNSGFDPGLFRSILSNYLSSASSEEQKLANLAIGWSLYEDYTVGDLPEDAIPYFERYSMLDGRNSATIRSLSEKYFDRGVIARAMHSAFQCDVMQVKHLDQPHEYVRLLYLTENGTKIPDKKIMILAIYVLVFL
jgi:hypothetical protein